MRLTGSDINWNTESEKIGKRVRFQVSQDVSVVGSVTGTAPGFLRVEADGEEYWGPESNAQFVEPGLAKQIREDGRIEVRQDGELIGLFNSESAAESYIEHWNEDTQRYEGSVEELTKARSDTKIFPKAIATLLVLASLGGCAMTPEEQAQWQGAMYRLQNVGNQMMYMDAVQRANAPQLRTTTCHGSTVGVAPSIYCTSW